MKLSARGKRVLQTVNETDGHFMEDLEHSLVDNVFQTDIGIDQFERLYQKKRILSDTIQQYRDKNKYYQSDIQRAKQRICQIAQLNDKANKQSIMMRNQINKINDAHMVSKILMMEKIVKLGMENENMQKKRIQCHKIRQQKERLTHISHSLFEKKQRSREMSVLESKAMKSHIQDINYQTIEQKKSRAERIRSEKQRRKQKFLRYQKFKLEMAQKNYLSKTQGLRKNLQQKQKLLQHLYLQQEKQKRHYQTTQQVTKQYLQSMYHTAENSTVQNSTLFPTQTL